MTNWPDKPLIRIKKGRERDLEVRDAIAVATDIDCSEGDYYMLSGPRAGHTIICACTADFIDEWEEVATVPTAALRHLRDVFLGVELPLKRFAAIQQVVSHLPADKPSTLDQAVTRVKDVEGAPMVDAETLPAERLSLLLDALASVQGAAHKTAPLTMVTRICADWVQADNPEKIALEQMQSRALSIPEVVGSDPARFIVLAGYIGDATNMLSNAHLDVSGQLTNAGTYALAWAAQIIEEEDK